MTYHDQSTDLLRRALRARGGPGIGRGRLRIRRLRAPRRGLTLNGDAAAVGGRLRLTPAEFLKRGSAWYTESQAVGGGFDTTFQFRITEPAGRFNDPAGEPGGEIFLGGGKKKKKCARRLRREPGLRDDTGTPGIARSLAVEFDAWFNPSSEWDDPDGNHISVHMRGLLPNSAHEMFSLASTTAIPNLSDGSIHTARVLYIRGSLRIYLDDLPAPRLVVPLDLGPTLGLDDGRAWVGFTSATWNAWENHDIHRWSFAAVPSRDRWCCSASVPRSCSASQGDAEELEAMP